MPCAGWRQGWRTLPLDSSVRRAWPTAEALLDQLSATAERLHKYGGLVSCLIVERTVVRTTSVIREYDLPVHLTIMNNKAEPVLLSGPVDVSGSILLL